MPPLILPPIAKPQKTQSVSLHDIFFGPSVDPLVRINGYSEDEFEAFIQEWAFEYLQLICGEYVQVSRFGGAGDKGRDVVCYRSLSPVECDIIQCKHYDSKLTPTDIWIELAKLCYHTFKGTIPVPKKYRFVSPKGVGPKLGTLLEKPGELKSGLIAEWLDTTKKGPLSKQLIEGKDVLLKDGLLTHVNGFDFSIVNAKPILEVVHEFRKTNRYAARFGGGLTKPLPPDKLPPDVPTQSEQVYTEALLAAYEQNLQLNGLDIATLKNHEKHFQHFVRSRERFYCAETIREFSKDSVPPEFPFEDVQNSIYDVVVDTEQGVHPCGFARVVAVTDKALSVTLTSSAYATYLKPKSIQGVCHQLANLSRLKWVHT